MTDVDCKPLRYLGSIEIIVGPMFSGKTEELIRRIREAEAKELSVLKIKPSVDTRYAASQIVSHNEQQIDAFSVDSVVDILSLVDNHKVIAIDEVQFFDKGIIPVCEQLANEGKRLIISGLDMDYKGEPFGIVPELMARSEFVTKLHSVCSKCGSMAIYSHRKSSVHRKILLGANDIYEPLCRACFRKLNIR